MIMATASANDGKDFWNAAAAFDFAATTTREVDRAIERERATARDFGALLSPAASSRLEKMARRARDLTDRFFGRNISLYTPLYIANHCVNSCVYCGYNRANPIRRARLSLEEIEREAAAVASTGLREILLLTGESRTHSDVAYIAGAIGVVARHFSAVGVEVYPMDEEEYGELRGAGADFISVYQETYDPDLYDRVHLAGPKKKYHYRLGANTRALAAGFRGASFGALLGLGDFRRDAMACGLHAFAVHKSRPHAEIGLSVPRLRSFPNQEEPRAGVSEAELLQVILAYRLFMPWASISLSTRESARFRDNCVGLGVTRLSAGVRTGVGGHAGGEKGDPQFHKADARDVREVCLAVRARNRQPVFGDHIRV